MFHPATFHHRLYLGQVAPILLDAMYAFAARTCTSPALIACYPPNQPPWLRGDVFAERAHDRVEKIFAAREAQAARDPSRLAEGTWEALEEAQAFTVLSIYFACLRQAPQGLFYLDSAVAMLRPSTMLASGNAATIEQATLAECRNRTFWLVVLHDLCAAANGRQRVMMDRDIEDVPLPGPEGWWVKYGGATREGEEGRGWRRDGLVSGAGDWPGEEGQVGELGHVLRIVSRALYSVELR
jgi:hypothetical protein